MVDKARPRLAGAALTTIALLLVTVAFYWKLLLPKQYTWVAGRDVAYQNLPWFQEEARQWKRGAFPLWDPHIWLGQPILGQAQPGGAAPLNWLLFAGSHKGSGDLSDALLNKYFILIHFLALLFCYLLCRDSGLSRPASLIAGMIFSFVGFMGLVTWPQMLNAAIWAPLVFLFLLRVSRGYRPLESAALGGMFLGISWLAGHHQMPMFLTLAAMATWAFLILRRGRPDWRSVAHAAIFLVIAGLTGALQILPAAEFGHLALRWVGALKPVGWQDPIPYYIHAQYSFAPRFLPGIVIPHMPGYIDAFAGIVALSLGVLAVVMCWRRPAVRFFAMLAACALLYALGPRGVIEGLSYALIPEVDKSRAPSCALLLFTLGIAVLAAAGADALLSGTSSAWLRRVPLALTGFGFLLFGILFTIQLANKGAWFVDDSGFLTAIFALLTAALITGWRHSGLTRTQAIAVLLPLLVIELYNGTGSLAAKDGPAANKDFERLRSNADIALFLHRQPGRFRIETVEDALPPNWPGYHDFDAIQSYVGGVTANVIYSDWAAWQTRLLFGLKYSIGAKAPNVPGAHEIFTGASGLKVWENPNVFPRAWAVHRAVQMIEPAQGFTMTRDHLDDMHDTALVSGQPPALDACSGDTVTLVKYSSSEVVIRADMKCRGMVVLSDTFYPGWQATVDGRAEPIREVDFCIRGVVVPAGAHQLKFRYRPASVIAGGILTVTGVLLALGTVFVSRRRE